MTEKPLPESKEERDHPTALPGERNSTVEGGYDCHFVEPVPDELLCRICQLPTRDPLITECCGYNFCKYCLDHYLQSKVIDHEKCLSCQEEKFQTIRDKRAERKILDLKVFCPNKSLGCSWVGELRSMHKHLKTDTSCVDGCPFAEVMCSLQCGQVMQRKLLAEHLKHSCAERQVTCEYCSLTGSYRLISGDHQQQDCLKYPVDCPNSCDVRRMKRGELAGHLMECLLAIVECPFSSVGCDHVLRRKERQEHLKECVDRHMKCNTDAIVSCRMNLEKNLANKEIELQEVQAGLQDTQQELGNAQQELAKSKQEVHEARQGLKTNEESLKNTQRDLNKALEELKECKQQSTETKQQLTESIQSLKKNEESLKSTQQKLDKTVEELKESKQQLTDAKQDLKKTQETLAANGEQMKKMKQFVDSLMKITWSLQLPQLAGQDNKVAPCVLKLSNFEDKRKKGGRWESPCFYASKRGYKMRLFALPGGFGSGHGNHITVDVYLMRGDYDDELRWPIEGELSIQLLNQLSDDGHSKPVKITIPSGYGGCKRVTGAAMAACSCGLCDKFHPHNQLGYDFDKNTQYLKDDSVFFRVCRFQ